MAPGVQYCSDCRKPAVNNDVIESGSDIVTSNDKAAVWNPNAAVAWSLLLTPVFGTFLHMKNWQSLGDMGRYKSAQYWFYGSFASLGFSLIVPSLFNNPQLGEFVGSVFATGFLAAWYVIAGREQVNYVRGKFGTDYPRRPWGRALRLGAAGLLGYFFIILVMGPLIGLPGFA